MAAEWSHINTSMLCFYFCLINQLFKYRNDCVCSSAIKYNYDVHATSLTCQFLQSQGKFCSLQNISTKRLVLFLSSFMILLFYWHIILYLPEFPASACLSNYFVNSAFKRCCLHKVWYYIQRSKTDLKRCYLDLFTTEIFTVVVC